MVALQVNPIQRDSRFYFLNLDPLRSYSPPNNNFLEQTDPPSNMKRKLELLGPVVHGTRKNSKTAIAATDSTQTIARSEFKTAAATTPFGSAGTQPGISRLIALPGELRNKIFDCVIQDIEAHLGDDGKPVLVHSLARASHQIREEFLSLLGEYQYPIHELVTDFNFDRLNSYMDHRAAVAESQQTSCSSPPTPLRRLRIECRIDQAPYSPSQSASSHVPIVALLQWLMLIEGSAAIDVSYSMSPKSGVSRDHLQVYMNLVMASMAISGINGQPSDRKKFVEMCYGHLRATGPPSPSLP